MAKPDTAVQPTTNVPPGPLSFLDLAQAGLVMEDDGRTKLGDEFRLCASHLHTAVKADIANLGRNANTVLITSTRPTEGKSFSALNISAALAQTAKRPVVLVDADMKPGCLSELIGLNQRPGLFDMIFDPALRPADLLIATPVRNLSVIPIGGFGTRAEPARHERPLTEVLDVLSAALTECTLIVDTSPLLYTSDPGVLAPAVSRIVIIVEAERTQKSQLFAAMELIRDPKKVLLMLNKISSRQRSRYGAYGYYGDYYGRTYGSSAAALD